MTNDTFKFSRDSVRQISGGIASDVDYLRFYRDACVSNIEDGARLVRIISDGAVPFDASLLAHLRAQLARIRFHVRALEDVAEQFKLKPALSRPFVDAHRQALQVMDEAVKEAHYVERCFEPSSAQLDRLSGYTG